SRDSGHGCCSHSFVLDSRNRPPTPRTACQHTTARWPPPAAIRAWWRSLRPGVDHTLWFLLLPVIVSACACDESVSFSMQRESHTSVTVLYRARYSHREWWFGS